MPRGPLLRWCGWFFAANWVVWLLISLRYLGAMPAPEPWDARAFLVLAFVGHYATLLALPLLAVVVLALLWPRRGAVEAAAVAVAAATVLVLLVDTVVFAQYRFHINGMVVGLLLSGAAGDIFAFSGLMWALAGLGLAVVLAAEWGLGRLVRRWVLGGAGRGLGPLLAAAMVLAALGQNGWYAWANAARYTPITRQARFLPGYQPAAASDLMAALGVKPRPAAAMRLSRERSALDYPRAPMRCRTPAEPYNLLVLVIDAWRFDMLTPAVTPNIHALAQESWRFSRHFSGGNESRTGLFTLMYGVPGTYWHDMLQEQRGPVLVHELLEAGYRPGIYASARLSAPEFDRTVFTEVPDLRVESPAGANWRRDQVRAEQMEEFLADAADDERPFFGFMFFDATHGNYNVPPDDERPFKPYWEQINYLALDNDFDRTPYLNRYKNAVHFVDRQVGRVLRRLEAEGLADDTVVVVTGDHGEEFNDNGRNYWGHTGNFTRYQTQVPLVVRWPGARPHTFTHRTSHVDLVPTLLQSLLGCRNPAGDYGTGQHLLDPRPRDYLIVSAYNRFAVVGAEAITVYYFAGLVERYDHRARPLDGFSPDSQQTLAAMRAIGRFYAR